MELLDNRDNRLLRNLPEQHPTMKFTPICLALALLSPVAALRGQRRLEDIGAGDVTESPEDAITESPDENESGTFFAPFTGVGDFPLAAAKPTPAPTWSASQLASLEAAGQDAAMNSDAAELEYSDAEHHKGGGGGGSKKSSKSKSVSLFVLSSNNHSCAFY